MVHRGPLFLRGQKQDHLLGCVHDATKCTLHRFAELLHIVRSTDVPFLVIFLCAMHCYLVRVTQALVLCSQIEYLVHLDFEYVGNRCNEVLLYFEFVLDDDRWYHLLKNTLCTCTGEGPRCVLVTTPRLRSAIVYAP